MPISRRHFLLSSTAAAAALMARPGRNRFFQPRRKPNLLFILADDLGYGDVSAFGRPDYKTPNIDRLVSEGVRFTNAYTAASTCTPSRVAYITGRYPQRQSPDLQMPMAYADSTGKVPPYGLSPEVPSIARMLKSVGYETALIGKWHLGYSPEFSPIRHGFDEFFGIKSGGVDYFTHTGRRNMPDLWEGDVTVDRVGYMTDLLSERAAYYVSRRHEAPFFLSLHYTAPHWPWEGPSDAHGDAVVPHDFSEGGSQPVFREMMKSLDSGIGKVIDALGQDRARNTLVIFTSDNGGERFSYNWPWSDGKFSLREGGIRVPAAMRWIGTLQPKRSCDQLSITMDWTATLLAAAGYVPQPNALDGMDLMPCAVGAPSAERTLYWRQPYPNETPHAAMRHDSWKYLRIGKNEFLYDVSIDPGEKADLKRRYPDVLREMREQWSRWDAQMVPARVETTPP